VFQVACGFILVSRLLFTVTMELRFLLVPDNPTVAARLCGVCIGSMLFFVVLGFMLSPLPWIVSLVVGLLMGVACVMAYPKLKERLRGALSKQCYVVCVVAVGCVVFLLVWPGVSAAVLGVDFGLLTSAQCVCGVCGWRMTGVLCCAVLLCCVVFRFVALCRVCTTALCTPPVYAPVQLHDEEAASSTAIASGAGAGAGAGGAAAAVAAAATGAAVVSGSGSGAGSAAVHGDDAPHHRRHSVTEPGAGDASAPSASASSSASASGTTAAGAPPPSHSLRRAATSVKPKPKSTGPLRGQRCATFPRRCPALVAGLFAALMVLGLVFAPSTSVPSASPVSPQAPKLRLGEACMAQLNRGSWVRGGNCPPVADMSAGPKDLPKPLPAASTSPASWLWSNTGCGFQR